MQHSKNIIPFTSLAFTFVALLLAAVPSEAFRMIQNSSTGRVTSGSLVTCTNSGGFLHWTTDQISWRHNTAGQGSGKASALQSAMAAWTNVPNANHTLNYSGTTSAGWSTDGINTVLWANGNGCTGSCLALTALVLQSGQVIVESDITFNAAVAWNTNGSDYDTQAVATHEFGHALGIHHTEVSSSPRPTMFASYFGTDGRTLENDDKAALQCSQSRYPVGTVTTTQTFTSIAAEDGRIVESSEFSNIGGTVDATATGAGALRIGDNSADRQHRAFLSFGTGPIPDGATILSATVQLRRGSSLGTNPFTTHSPCRVDIKNGFFGSRAALVASDFQAAATVVGAGNLSNPTANGSLSTATLNSAGRNAINKTGRTQIRLYCNLDDNDDLDNDHIGFYSAENGTVSNRPVLIVTYQ